MNKLNIRTLKETIERIPDPAFNMGEWGIGELSIKESNVCGSFACLAGWAYVQQHGFTIFEDIDDDIIVHEAMGFLGLASDWDAMFYPDQWPAEIQERVSAIGERKAAIELLDLLLEDRLEIREYDPTFHDNPEEMARLTMKAATQAINSIPDWEQPGHNSGIIVDQKGNTSVRWEIIH